MDRRLNLGRAFMNTDQQAVAERRMRPAVRVSVVAVAVGVGMLLGGCQTVKGVGEDIQNAGEAGERAINGE